MSQEKNKRRKTRRAAGQAPERQKRRRRKGNNILWYLLILVFMVTTTIVLTTTVFFKIKNITVTGNEHYDNRSLILSSGILLEENMFRLKDEQIKEKLVEEYSYISKVKIRRKLPDTIVLEITEATPIGAIDAGAGYTLISEEGRVLECNTPVLPEEMPIVMGFSEETPEQGSYLSEMDSDNVKRMQMVMKAAEKTGFSYFNIIDLSDPYDLKLYYQEVFEIILGTDSNLEYKMELILKVIETQNLLTGFRGTIDASYEGEVWTRPSGSVAIPDYSSQLSNDAADPAGDDGSTSDSGSATSQPEDNGFSVGAA